MTSLSRRLRGLLIFAGLCYGPLLGTSPGYVLADTKSYLYLDPDRLLARAASMWDLHVGLGTVTHQNIGFLWPMGPYYWLMEHLGVPDWTAQRLWLGTILFAAGLGVRYLLRTFGWRGSGVAVAMCSYAFTPYLLTISVRISAILLPFVALPWMIGLTARAIRTGSWRHPALFALLVATVGTSNATSILLVGIGPALWAIWALAMREQPPWRIVAALGRIGSLTLLTNAWWIVGLSVQATNGVDVLRYTESVQVTAAASSAQEVLRGLGYWFFYGDDAIGPWVGPSRPFQSSLWLLTATFAVPVLALAGGALGRWRERSFVILLAVVGLTLAVGVYPYDDPSAFGRVLRPFLHSDVGMAMRSMPRAAPLVVLALSVMLGAGVQAVAERLPRRALPVSAAVIGLVLVSLPPLWQRTLVPANLRRPEAIPDYWDQAASALDATDDGTRVLELPGADFASYRWGTTVDPVTPGLTDRPIVARELVPMGSAAAANLLKALDGRMQANVAEGAALAPIARAMRAGQILLRSDLRYEQYDTPRPRALWHALLATPGLGPPTEVGQPTANIARAPAPMLDELELSQAPTGSQPFPITIFPVQAARPIVSLQAAAAPLIVAGDGDGLVDSAAAGLIDGNELIRYSASMTDSEIRQALEAGAVLIVTDSNRRRAERWGTIRFTSGYTEPADLEPLVIDRSDARLPLFPNATDAARTVALHRGDISAKATSYGGRNEYWPEDRAANAVDGDPSTSWRASRDDPVLGQRLELQTRRPVTPHTLTFLAPPAPINRWITRVALRFDHGPVRMVDLDERSHSGEGQTIDIGARTFSHLSIEVRADSAGPRARYGGLSSTGFAEVRIGSLTLDEAVRPPIDLLARAGVASADHALAIVLTRLRSAVTDIERRDEELAVVRVVDLPGPRDFTLAGTARLAPRAADSLIDRTLEPAAATRLTSSSRMAGPASRARAAFDTDPTTAWTAAFGDQTGQWLEATAAAPITVDHLDVHFLTDGRHSVPTQLGLEVDGVRVATMPLDALPDTRRPGATTKVAIPLPAAVTARSFRLIVDGARTVETSDWGTRLIRTLPVAVAEVSLGDLAQPAPTGRFDTGCRTDLLMIDGAPAALQATGTMEDALAGAPLTLTACDGRPLRLSGGSHELRSTAGTDSGIDVDRVVLRSAPGGTASPDPADTLRHESTDRPSTPVATSTVTRDEADSLSLRIAGARRGEPLWLAFGQSWNTGWQATMNGDDLGPPTLVDGYANGWLITPTSTSFEVRLRFTPQHRVDVALWASLLAAMACIGLSIRRPRIHGAPTPEPPRAVSMAAVSGAPHPPLPRRTAVTLGVLVAAVGGALATPIVGLLAGGLAVVVARSALPRWLTALIAPIAMAASATYVVLTVARHQIAPGLEWPGELHRAHPLAWLAVLALAVDAIVAAARAGRHDPDRR